MSSNCNVYFLLLNNTKFYHQINGGDQFTVNQMTEIQNELSVTIHMVIKKTLITT
jgi:hypothetical protein